MGWLNPTYGLALIAVPVVLWFYWRVARWRRGARDRFGESRIVAQLATVLRPYRRRVKAGLVALAVFLLVLSLMGPRFGTTVRTVERRGVDLVVALDVSASMRAGDVPPSRLRRAKNEIRELMSRLSGDRVGLVLFAGDSIVQCPLTTDYDAFRMFLDVAGPDQLAVPGTDMGSAMDAAVQAFEAARPQSDSAAADGQGRPRALLLVSDGENHLGDLGALQQRAEEANVTVLAAGVGTDEGARVPEYRNGERIGFKRDQEGQLVQSRLQEEVLTRLAETGAYFRIGPAASALSDVPAALRQIGSSSYAEEQFSDYEEMFQWPLAAALLLLFVESVIPVRVRSRRLKRTWARIGDVAQS